MQFEVMKHFAGEHLSPVSNFWIADVDDGLHRT
jgi:hypothetical protein